MTHTIFIAQGRCGRNAEAGKGVSKPESVDEAGRSERSGPVLHGRQIPMRPPTSEGRRRTNQTHELLSGVLHHSPHLGKDDRLQPHRTVLPILRVLGDRLQ